MAATEQRPVQATRPAAGSGPASSLSGRWFWAAWLWAALLVLFVVLAALASFYDRFPGDERISRAIQDVDVPAFGGFMDAVNLFGDSWFYFLLLFLLAGGLVFVRAGWEALALLLVVVPVLLNPQVKSWVDRERPSEFADDLPSSLSYPSGHTVATAALFLMLLFIIPAVVPWRAARWFLQAGCVLMIAAAGPARVYVGVHWPSDALGGYLLALLCVAPVLVAYRALSGRGRRPRPAASASKLR